MYFGGSVAGKPSTIGIEISPITPLIFAGRGSKSEKFGVVFSITQFEPPAFENAATYPNAETSVLCRNDRPMSSPCLAKLGLRILRTAQ